MNLHKEINKNKYFFLKERYKFIYFFKSRGFPGGSAGKESASSMGDLGSIPGLGRSPGEGNSYPLQYSGLENSMDYIVARVDFHFSFT